MDTTLKSILWNQLGAAIDMLHGAIHACPESLWREKMWVDTGFPGSSEFWYVAYHAIFWTDYDASDTYESFQPPAPFTRSEFDPAGALPDRVYTKQEIETYLEYTRNKCWMRIENLDDPLAVQQVRLNWIEMSVAELLVYSTRHVMEHEGLLSMLLGQHDIQGDWWVSRAKELPIE